MKRPDHHAALDEELARFQAEIRRFARDAARAIVQEELARRLTRLRARPGAMLAARTQAVAPAPPVAAREAPVPAAPVSPTPPAAAPPPLPPIPPPGGERKGRITWTRESIINELASWMTSGTSIDAAFITRYGPPGLVAATRRIFGRFDAALNVAGLHLSKLYPDGPPER